MTETQVHLDAFELYYSLKAERSYKRVAEEIGVTVANVGVWGKEFNWQQRVVERDKEIASRVAEKNIEEEVDIRTKLFNAIGLTIDKYTENLLQGQVDANRIKDLVEVGGLWKELEEESVNDTTQAESDTGVKFNVKVRVVQAGGDYEE